MRLVLWLGWRCCWHGGTHSLARLGAESTLWLLHQPEVLLQCPVARRAAAGLLTVAVCHLPLHCSPSQLSVICRIPPACPLLPRPHPGVLDESANTLFLTELWRGLAMTLKCFFEPPVTVSGQQSRRVGHPGRRGGPLNRPLQRGGGPVSQSGCMSGPLSTAHWVLMPLATLNPAPPRSTTHLRRARCRRASVASTRCGATPRARSAASPASCARR